MSNKIRRLYLMIGLFMATVLVGCATTVFEGYQPDGRYCFRISKRKVCTADPAPTVDAEAKAKQFEPLADRTIVWIVSNAPLDPYGKVTVKVHGLEVVMLPHAVARAVLPPGPIRLDAVVGSRDVDVLTIVGKPGEQLFVEVYADVGLFATYFSLHRTPDDEGRRKVLASKLIKDVTSRALFGHQ